MRAGEWVGILTEDQRCRASGVVGLYKGLHLYFSDDLGIRLKQQQRLETLPEERVIVGDD